MTIESLSKAEQAYFDSRGESETPVETPDPSPTEPVVIPAPEPEKVETKVEAPKTEEVKPEPEKAPVHVPLAELQEERKRRKAESEKREEAERNYLKLNERLSTLMEVAKAQQAPTVKDDKIEVPDITADPVGHFKAQTEILRRQLEENLTWRKEQEDFRKKQEDQTTQVNNIQRLGQIVSAKEVEFRTTTPDYDEASVFLRQMRDGQLLAFGHEDLAERQQLLNQDAVAIAAQALAKGKNPAEVIYNMAKASGWKPKTAAPPAVTATALPTQPASVTDEQKVKMASNGQKANQSLSQIAGAATPPVTLESLLKLSDDEFAKATKGDKWRRLFT